jgi:hypothetical protein
MVLSILNSRFLPRIVVFIGSSTEYSANLTLGNLQVHSHYKVTSQYVLKATVDTNELMEDFS